MPPRPTPTRTRVSALLAAIAAAVALSALPAQSTAKAPAPVAQQASKAVKANLGPGHVAVRCTRVGAKRRGRYTCRWKRTSAGRSCTGRHSATRQGRRWRVRRAGQSCRAAPTRKPAAPRAPTPAPAATASPAASRPAPPAASAPIPAGEAQAARRGPLFGFNDNSVPRGVVSAEDDARLTAALGATSVRYTVDWRWAERAPGEIRLDAYDDLYEAMVRRGIRPILVPAFAPSWAMDPGTCNQWQTDCKYPPARDQADAYGSFAALLARRYPQAAAIEVWNEPNQNFFWQSGPDPERYAHLVAATYRRVKQAAPGMTVLGGAIADNPSTRDGMPPGRFLRTLYGHGLANSIDGLSLHAYPQLLDQTLAEARSIRNAAGDSGRKIWLTETGYTTTGTRSTTWPSWWAVSETQQASGLVALHERLTTMKDVEAVLFHTLVEPRGDRVLTPGPGYGVVREEGLDPKPAFCALARARSASGCS